MTYRNLAVFPIVARVDIAQADLVTLDEALASGDAMVTERGSATVLERFGRPLGIGGHARESATVSELVLVYRGSKPLVLLAGEIVKGGKQDRIISTDLIIPSGADPLPLDVFCVEHGRWSEGSDFSSARLMAHPTVREAAAVDRNQQRVWTAVRSGSQRPVDPAAPAPVLSEERLAAVSAAAAPTGSYRSLYQADEVVRSVEPFTAEIRRRFEEAASPLGQGRVVGVVVAYGGEIAWSDEFASADLFERYWPKLLRSYVVEALTRSASHEVPSVESARQFLEPVAGAARTETEPGVYRRTEVTRGRAVEISLEAVGPLVSTVHRTRMERSGGSSGSR